MAANPRDLINLGRAYQSLGDDSSGTGERI
jgi:hypothetical protein